MDSVFSYPALKLYTQGSQVLVQPTGQSAGNGADSNGATETLQIDLRSGAVSVSQKQGTPAGEAFDSMGLLGVCKLHTGKIRHPVVCIEQACIDVHSVPRLKPCICQNAWHGYLGKCHCCFKPPTCSFSAMHDYRTAIKLTPTPTPIACSNSLLHASLHTQPSRAFCSDLHACCPS